MKNQALFSSNDRSKKLKCHLLQFLLGALRVNFYKYCIAYKKSLKKSHSYLEICKRVTGKQCRPRSDAKEWGI